MTQPSDPALTFPFLGGRPCLDFVATLGKRHATPLERLPDPGALGRWITEAELASEDGPLTVTARDLADARALREAVYRVVWSAMAGRESDAVDVALVNEVAARPDLAPQLGPGRWTARHPVRAALATVARDAVLLVGGPLLERVKECGNPDCSLLFLDDSQARRRRWCSMERCGNLAKVAGYRSRNRAASTR
ncbi:CGNR zinc finger domain-containing protein [Streptomyces diastatochromogenes]|uniref:4-hydroxybenzoyl-CoA reductase n=1 Tax=Streptomyces diastatochromogenes TaxID=42236 RepID=A0A233SAN3_STRDA|nr:CGNR zinc finger domain-containing protein [Streptomyces diastatochromogenes]MCZ0985227.1 CGNR zinc finger domain-containing protein [Streptomyces diastatochromogenes]OXY92711.1 4-hydroxybenzoyl-CoA reductase [Streptomyces diastatochromogenes]